MEVRKPFRGVINIIRFNWPYYFFPVLAGLVILLIAGSFNETLRDVIYISVALGFTTIFFSLVVSWFIYDLSSLYRFPWLTPRKGNLQILNIHAGFDETSGLLQHRFIESSLTIFDFYNPKLHTEPSIERARKAYPAHAGTLQVDATNLPLADNSIDMTFVIFAAHEIRNPDERKIFFRELHRVTKTGGEIFVTEHLRDLRNFLAFNIGFLHFYPRSSWFGIFHDSGLNLEKEVKTTPFITTFILRKNGITS